MRLSEKVEGMVRGLLKKYDARHLSDCPQRQQNYWRLRGEYRPADYGPDKECTCGLDDILGKPDDRKQS